MIRVAVADDQTLVRTGFVALLDAADDITVVAEAADGLEAVRAAARHRPDVFVMDIRMPGLDGVEATRRIVGDPVTERTRVLVLTTYELDEYVVESLRAGASGFVTKEIEPDALRDAVRTVADGHALLAPSVTRRVIDAFVRSAPPTRSDERLSELTDRERDVLACVARGLSNAEIATELHMSPLTAKSHVSHLLTKLDVRSRAQLVVLAYETGFASRT